MCGICAHDYVNNNCKASQHFLKVWSNNKTQKRYSTTVNDTMNRYSYCLTGCQLELGTIGSQAVNLFRNIIVLLMSKQQSAIEFLWFKINSVYTLTLQRLKKKQEQNKYRLVYIGKFTSQ